MKKLSKMMVATAALCMVFFACYAKSVYWGGATTGTWEVGNGGAATGGWLDAPNGSPTTFEDGDDVVLGDAPGEVSLTLKGKFTVGDFLFTAANQYKLTPTSRTTSSTPETINGTITSAKSFTKTGSGTLYFNNFTGGWSCDMSILQGRLRANSIARAAALDIVSSPLGDLSRERTITVGTGDTNSFAYLKLTPWTTPEYVLTVKTEDFAAPLNIILDAGIMEEMERADSLILSRPLILRNKSVVNDQVWLRDSLHIQRRTDNNASPASSFTVSRNAFHHNFGTVNDAKPFPIIVDDVTSSDPNVVDNVVDFTLNNYMIDYSLNGVATRNSFVKKGKGKMLLSGAQSSFTGDITIEEGEIYVSSQAQVSGNNNGVLGNSYTNRQIVVCSNAVLTLERAESMARVSYETPTVTMILTNNATLKTGGYNTFGNLKFYNNPKVNVTGVTNGKDAFGFSETTYFKTDNSFLMRPNDMSSDNSYRTRLDYRYEKKEIDGGTYGYSEFCVDRIVNRETHFLDLIMDYVLYDHMKTADKLSEKYYCGIVKTGDGVLSLNRSNTYRNNTLVREGGLWLGKTYYNNGASYWVGSVVSNVVVSSDAFIGGVGTIKDDLIIENGGGFMVDATNTTAQLTVNKSLTLPSAGLIKLYNVTETDLSKIHFEKLPIPNASTYIGLDDIVDNTWRVEVDGFTRQETKHLKVKFDKENKDYSIYFAKSGLKVILR